MFWCFFGLAVQIKKRAEESSPILKGRSFLLKLRWLPS